MICNKKIPTKLKLLIYQTVLRPTMLYGCETWPMSVKDGRQILEWCDGQWGEPFGTQEKEGDPGRGKGGTDSDGYEMEKAGMVRARQKNR